jgi:hypothetical protein
METIVAYLLFFIVSLYRRIFLSLRIDRFLLPLKLLRTLGMLCRPVVAEDMNPEQAQH